MIFRALIREIESFAKPYRTIYYIQESRNERLFKKYIEPISIINGLYLI